MFSFALVVFASLWQTAVPEADIPRVSAIAAAVALPAGTGHPLGAIGLLVPVVKSAP
jgi:hypothetical protein